MRIVAALAVLLAASAGAAAPQPRVSPGDNRAICLDTDGVPDAVSDAVIDFLRRQLAAATRGEAVVEGSAACDATGGDVVVRLTLGPTGDRIGLTATDGQATYRDETVPTGRLDADAIRLAERFFLSLWFEPHE